MKMFSGQALIDSLDKYHEKKLGMLMIDPEGINGIIEDSYNGIDKIYVVNCLLKLVGKEEPQEALLILDDFIYEDIVYDMDINSISQEIH